MYERMEFLITLVPVAVFQYMVVFRWKDLRWWHLIVLFLPVLTLNLLTSHVFVLRSPWVSEWGGSYVTSVFRGPTGDTWYRTDSRGRTTEIGEGEYDLIRSIWTGASPEGAWEDSGHYVWPGDPDKGIPLTIVRPWASSGWHRASDLRFQVGPRPSREVARSLGLYDYPVTDTYSYQNPVIGDKLTWSQTHALAWYNATTAGPRIYLLIWDALETGPGIVLHQSEYWAGGGQGELIVCVGLRPDRTIEWAHCFGHESGGLSGRVRGYLESRTGPLDVKGLVRFVEGAVKEGSWNPDTVSGKVHLEWWQYCGILGAVLAYNILTGAALIRRRRH